MRLCRVRILTMRMGRQEIKGGPAYVTTASALPLRLPAAAFSFRHASRDTFALSCRIVAARRGIAPSFGSLRRGLRFEKTPHRGIFFSLTPGWRPKVHNSWLRLSRFSPPTLRTSEAPKSHGKVASPLGRGGGVADGEG